MVEELTELIQEGRALLFGPIRQELLSGISDIQQFKTLPSTDKDFSRYAKHLPITLHEARTRGGESH